MFPKCEPKFLQVTLSMASLSFLLFGLFNIYRFTQFFHPVSAALGIVSIFVSGGLWLVRPTAVSVANFLLVAIGAVLPFGLFDPFTASEAENLGHKVMTFSERMSMLCISEIFILYLLITFSVYRDKLVGAKESNHTIKADEI